MSDKALVLLSGGLDSTTALAWATDYWGVENVRALIMKYGQKHLKEIERAQKVANYYGVPCKIVEFPESIWEDSQCTLLEGRADIEESTYAEQITEAKSEGKAMIDTSIPFRNGVFLSVAAAVASSLDCTNLVIGVHQDDSGAAYPDCSETFIKHMSNAVQWGTGHSVHIVTPWIEMTKDQIVEWGLAHNVPYELTWSCYKGGKKACGKCATCRDRLKAFKLNGSEDPIEYEVN